MGNKSKGFLLILLIALVFLNSRYNLIEKSIGKTSQSNKSLPLNTSREGVSIFYDTLKTLNYSVAVDGEDFLEKKDGNIYILTENKTSMNFTLKEAEDWIQRGGKLIYLTNEYYRYEYPHLLDKYEDKAFLYTLGRGKLLIGDINLITNDTLLKNREGAHFVLKGINSLGGKILFNEYYRFIQGESPSLYRNLPLPIKILLFQGVLALIGCIFYLGKRFGIAKRMIDEIERDENEYLYASANLYEKGQCMDMLYDVFYREFETELKKTFKQSSVSHNWIDLWTSYNLPFKQEAMGVYNHRKENQKVELGVIKNIDQLTQILIKRRETAWDKLRQQIL